eukprot:3941639-Rhodomonas_salina.1
MYGTHIGYGATRRRSVGRYRARFDTPRDPTQPRHVTLRSLGCARDQTQPRLRGVRYCDSVCHAMLSVLRWSVLRAMCDSLRCSGYAVLRKRTAHVQIAMLKEELAHAERDRAQRVFCCFGRIFFCARPFPRLFPSFSASFTLFSPGSPVLTHAPTAYHMVPEARTKLR